MKLSELFSNSRINDFEKLPDESSVKAKFAKLFKQFSTHLEAATIQGFNWNENIYPDEHGSNIIMKFDEMTYLILLARYKELAKGGGGGRGGDVPMK